MYKFLTNKLVEYIFIILTATIFSIIVTSKSLSEENVFIVDNVEVSGDLNLNYSREKYINKAFVKSFNILMSKILLSKDLNKIKQVDFKKIKSLINSFQISKETFHNNEYKGKFRIFYNDKKVKNLLLEKNVSFSQPKEISAIFFPVLLINSEIKDFKDNYFYKYWTTIEIKNELINFILPLEDLDDIFTIKEMTNNFEKLNVNKLVNKYNLNNYVFALMEYNNKKLNIHIKTNFNDNKISKNIFYKIADIEDEEKLNYILKDLKMKVTDIWKEENVVNLLMPLSINIKFNQKTLLDLDNLKSAFYKIEVIDNYVIEEFDINNSLFKIYYYGSPKRLQTELYKYGYLLKNDKGYWELYKK
jgi:hypothetical protein